MALKVVVEPAPRASRLLFECERPFQVSLIYPQYSSPQLQPTERIDGLYYSSVTLWTGSSVQCKASGHTFEIKEVAR